MPQIRICTLADNSVFGPVPPLLGEHGLSIYVEYDGKRILFDTGGGHTLLHNAEKLDIDLSSIDMVVISHGHGDHMGGLKALLEASGPKDIYVHPDVFAKKAVKRDGRFSIKPMASRDELEQLGANFIFRSESRQIFPGLWLIGPIPRKKPSDDIKMPFRYRKNGEDFIPDSFSDEQILAIESPCGLILVLGCTHNGLENTIDEALRVTGARKVHTLIGGLHLAGVEPRRLGRIADYLIKLGIQNLLSCHCTGQKEVAVLYQLLGESCRFNRVGNFINITW